MRKEFRFAVYPLLGIGIILSVLILVIWSQGKEREPVQVGEMQEYRDPGIGFSIQYPRGWIANAQVGRAYFYNDHDVEQKFLDPRGSHAAGVVIAITAKKTSDVATTIKKFRGELAASGSIVGTEEIVMVGKHQGVKFPYTASFDAKSVVRGYHILIAADSVLYDLGVAGFGDRFDAYTMVFDASLGSFQFPEQHEQGKGGSEEAI